MRDYEGRLVRYARRFVGTEVGREVVQETFTRIWKESPEKLASREREWLFCVCRNLAIDHLKKEKHVKFDTIEIPQDPEQDGLEENETLNGIQKTLKSLTPPQQEVVRLKFQESMSYQEISNVTGHSVSYVGVLLHEAMVALRKQMNSPKKGGN